MTYNAQGELASLTDPTGNTTTWTYADCTTGSVCGEPATRTNAAGQTTTFDAYDADGRLMAMTTPNGLKVRYDYDARGRLTALTETPPQGSPRRTTFTYDAAGALTTVTDALGASTRYTYDAAHALVAITDPLGNTASTTYDADGNPTGITLSDPQGRVAARLTAAYDLHQHLATWNDGVSTTSLVHDALGDLTRTTNALGATTSFQYTPDQDLTTTIDALGGVTQDQYDPAGQAIGLTTPNGAQTTEVRDDLGEVLSQSSPDTGTTTYTYDAAGDVRTRTDARGVVTTYTDDALHRVTGVTETRPAAGAPAVAGFLQQARQGLTQLLQHAGFQGPRFLQSPGTITVSYDACTGGIGRICGVTDDSGTTTSPTTHSVIC